MSEVIEETQADEGRSKVAKAADQAVDVGLQVLGPSHAHSEAQAHLDHGYAPARWAASAVSILGWLIGGIAFPFGVWPLVVVGGALQVVAIIVNLAMNAAGMGAKTNDRWRLAKADAKSARADAKAA
jgi:hypothetical protein